MSSSIVELSSDDYQRQQEERNDWVTADPTATELCRFLPDDRTFLEAAISLKKTRWHGTRYWGAPHGLAGILHVVLHFPLSQEDAEDVKTTLTYMMSNRFPNSGNYPSSEGNPRDKLVQWSHGATGMTITLSKASQVFSNERAERDGAIEAGELVWKSGLVKKVGLAENGYAFLSLYRLTRDAIYVERAKAFASFLYHNTSELVDAENCHQLDDHAYSLFLGLAGTSCFFFFYLLSPEKSRFPGYEL